MQRHAIPVIRSGLPFAIDVDQFEAEQFTAELAAAMTTIIAQLKSAQSK
jgi:hypothetical protein